ncbi:aspartate aminotransferase family protein [Ochrobactrum pecoris]|uniref:4-aminobutyrate--pyruvate transaminase n=1 Tax=Brucella pecoris TaxID=867683 RepID=A0A5C5CT04_9HYPH|nr:aspartate aminotransferase family protein [Brucella pecoris]MBB4093476.1 4-aminobutyrate--pyruvate transaminase [Brucella pecoris]NKW81179.1 aspartate aminotransferase family protein [Brucella pecoris]TNV13696.1 aspartate aminotransferase family protein [Brucella pecoris]
MTAQPNSLEARDIRYHLHSYTDAVRLEAEGPLVIERGDGIYVEDVAGKRYIEAMSGLWSVGVGFSEPRLAEAAARQMKKLPFYHTFSYRSHGPVIDLAEKLVSMAPVPMSKAYFTNSGSEANDTVIKLIWYRSNALGEPERKKIISRKRGYHGVTIASASLTGLPNNHRSFDLPIDRILHTGCPHHYREGQAGESEEQFATRLADELEQLIIAEGPHTIAAFIGEPVMGAGGVVVPPKTYWEKVQAVLKRYNILLVADEVICGFGRTGNLFGSQTFDMKPDILVMSKQLSSSYLPISAFLINERVYAPIAEESHKIGTLGTGFTASGHPVAAAVALENLAIIEERDLVANARDRGTYMQKRLRELQDHPLVGEVRGVGLIAGVELVTDKQAKTGLEQAGALGAQANAALQERGVISRAMGDTLAFCPPLIINDQQIDTMVSALEATLNDVQASLAR